MASAFGVPVQTLIEAGHGDMPEHDNGRQRLEAAFAFVLCDPDYRTSSAVQPGDVSPEVKRLVVEIYETATGHVLLASKERGKRTHTP